MKRSVLTMAVVLAMLLQACHSPYADYPGDGSDGEGIDLTEPPNELEQALVTGQDEEIVDLGCCVENITVRNTARLGANSVTHTHNDFVMTLNSDKQVYSTTDVIKIWGTLEYIGEDDTFDIWHGCPFMVFDVTDGKDFTLSGFVLTILAKSTLERNRVYHFDYKKSGSWSEDAPDAQYWRDFFNKPDLLLPEGEYTITLDGGFSLDADNVADSKSGLLCELVITVL